MPKPILLIDGDQFIFKATAAVEREVRWDDQNHVLYSNLNEAWSNLNDMLERVFTRFSSRDHALTFSSPPNFRMKVDETYKKKRADTRKPLCYAELRASVEDEFNCVSLPGLEADDVMGILATKPGNRERIIISQDKDMKTIPGKIFTGRGDMEVLEVSEAEADYWHLYQTLIGDASDGYKGCPGIGPKKAEAILAIPGKKIVLKGGSESPVKLTTWDAVVAAYTKAGFTEDVALTQARLARILRWQDWDAATKQPILWSPG